MNKIVINLFTDDESDINVSIKAECTLNELEIATGVLMGQLASTSTTGVEVLESLLSDIKEAQEIEKDIREEEID